MYQVSKPQAIQFDHEEPHGFLMIKENNTQLLLFTATPEHAAMLQGAFDLIKPSFAILNSVSAECTLDKVERETLHRPYTD